MGLISRVSSRTYRFRKKKTNCTTMVFVRGTELYSIELTTEEALVNFVASAEQAKPEELTFSVGGAPMVFAELNEEMTVSVSGKLLGGKVHGSLARAGKVKGQTPKVEAEEKKKRKTGRAARRAQYNRRFVTTNSAFGGKKKGPNCQADRVAK